MAHRNPNWPDKSFQEVVAMATDNFTLLSERGWRITTEDVQRKAEDLAYRFYHGKDVKRAIARLVKALQPVAARLNYRQYSKQVSEDLKMLKTLEEAGWRYLPIGDNPWGPGIWQHKSGCNVNRNGGVFDNIFEAAKRTLESATFQMLQEAQTHTA